MILNNSETTSGQVWLQLCRFVPREPAPNPRARKWSRRWVNKSRLMSGAREFTSCPSIAIDVTPPTVLPTSVPSLVEIWSQVAQQMHVGQPKIEWNSSYCFCPKMAPETISEHLISKKFPGGASPQTPLILHACLLMHIRHRRNPPSQNPGYGPDMGSYSLYSQHLRALYICTRKHKNGRLV